MSLQVTKQYIASCSYYFIFFFSCHKYFWSEVTGMLQDLNSLPRDYTLTNVIALAGVSKTLVISGHWRCNRRLWPLKGLQGPFLQGGLGACHPQKNLNSRSSEMRFPAFWASKQTAVRSPTVGGRPPVTGFYWNPCLGLRPDVSQFALLSGTFPDFSSVKQLGVFLLPNWMGC